MQLVSDLPTAPTAALQRRLVVRAVDAAHALSEAAGQLALSGVTARDLRVDTQLDACLYAVEATVLPN